MATGRGERAAGSIRRSVARENDRRHFGAAGAGDGRRCVFADRDALGVRPRLAGAANARLACAAHVAATIAACCGRFATVSRGSVAIRIARIARAAARARCTRGGDVVGRADRTAAAAVGYVVGCVGFTTVCILVAVAVGEPRAARAPTYARGARDTRLVGAGAIARNRAPNAAPV